jgi:hypothetical protein
VTDTTVPVNDSAEPVRQLANGIVDGVDVDALHAAALACPGIAGVGSAEPGALATYLPGRRVTGIRVNPDSIELEVCTRWDASARQVGAALQTSLKEQADGRRIDVTIVDIELPESEIR